MAVTLVASFAELAEACSKPLMAACAEFVLPPLETFFTNLFQNHRTNIGQTKDGPSLVGDQTNAVQIFGAQIPARELTIHDPKNKHWTWISDPISDTRFKEAAVLAHGSRSWEIKASINFDSLSADKRYGVYLIFKTTPDSEGLDAVLIGTVSTDIMDEPNDVCLSLKPKADADQKSHDIKLPVQSSYDEWMELELGQFLCSSIADKRVAEVTLKETGENNKRGQLLLCECSF